LRDNQPVICLAAVRRWASYGDFWGAERIEEPNLT